MGGAFYRKIMSGALAGVLSVALAAGSCIAESKCMSTRAATFYSGVRPWVADDAVGYTKKKTEVDSDGAPNSYLLDGEGLSYTCDGVLAIVDGVAQNEDNNPDEWQSLCRAGWAQAQRTGDYSHMKIFGFAMDDDLKQPVVQKVGEPLPGKAFVSTTSVSVPGTADKTTAHYVNALEIPYVVLSNSFVNDFHVEDGALAVVYWPKTKAIAYAVYADGGKLGEASVRLHQELGNNPITDHGGTSRADGDIDSPITTLVFPKVTPKISTNAAAWRAAIQKVGKTTFDTWGGQARLASCSQGDIKP